MRIMSFDRLRPKLHLELSVEQRPEFTTIRYFYWQQGWPVQVFFKSRSAKQRRKLGEAIIVKREDRELDWRSVSGYRGAPLLTDKEAQEDGFKNLADMVKWMKESYGPSWESHMIKLTLKWTSGQKELI